MILREAGMIVEALRHLDKYEEQIVDKSALQETRGNLTNFFWKKNTKNPVKPVLSSHSKIEKTKILMANGSLMKAESIAECSPWSILQYFWPALRDNWSWKPIFDLLFSGHLRQVLL